MNNLQTSGLLDTYPVDGFFDEMFDAQRQLRSHYAQQQQAARCRQESLVLP